MNDGGNGHSGLGEPIKYKELIAKVEDKKAAHKNGEKRLLVREKGKVRGGRISIDIDAREAAKVERKGTYKFQIEESEAPYRGAGTLRGKTEKKEYRATGTPESMDGQNKSQFDHFSEGSTSRKVTRRSYSKF